MKRLLLVCALFCTTALQAVTPGSAGVVNINLTLRATKIAKIVGTANGGAQATLIQTTTAFTNTDILKELQRLKRIPTGSLSGWRLMIAFDEEGTPLTVFANKSTKNVSCDGVVSLIGYGDSIKGVLTVGSNEQIAAVKVTGLEAYQASIHIKNAVYDFTALFAPSYAVSKPTSSISLLVNLLMKSTTVLGVSSGEQIIQGTVILEASTGYANLEKSFPGLGL